MRKLGIIAAMEEELEIIKNALEDKTQADAAHMSFYSGTIDGQELVIVQSGIGKVNAAMATVILVEKFGIEAVINTGSAVGISGCPYSMDYAASKGAVHAFTKSLALNVAERGIRVNAVAPGPVWTALTPGNSSEDDFANFGADTALGRVAQPEDIAPAYVFLAAPACASCITGVVMPVSAG